MLKNRKAKGFTLIELLVVVVIIGILAAIALPNFIGAQKKAKLASVKSNMHTAQLASESYATDTGGVYATTGALLRPYYPGGGNSPGVDGNGKFPTNPISNTADEAPVAAGIAGPVIDRTVAPADKGPGQVGYNAVADAANVNTSYAVCGYNDAGKAMPGTNPGTYMILSNQ